MATTYLITYVIAAWAIGIETSLFVLVPLVAPVLLTMLLPVTIAGWGVREGVATYVSRRFRSNKISCPRRNSRHGGRHASSSVLTGSSVKEGFPEPIMSGATVTWSLSTTRA